MTPQQVGDTFSGRGMSYLPPQQVGGAISTVELRSGKYDIPLPKVKISASQSCVVAKTDTTETL